MAMVDIGLTHWPTPCGSSPGLGGLTIDAADEVAGFVLFVRKTGTVNRIHFRTGAVTTGATLDIRLETVNANGEPTGTLFGTNTNVSHVVASTDDNVWHRTAALTGSASVTRGDFVAVVIVNPAVSFGNMSISMSAAAGNIGAESKCFPYGVNFNRTTKNSGVGLCALEYDDGEIVIPEGSLPMQTAGTSLSLSTSTNPDEVAMYFTAQAKMRVAGFWTSLGATAGANFRVNLYEVGNNTPLLTQDFDGDAAVVPTTRLFEGRFDSDYTLVAGTIYRLSILPLTTTALTVRYWECHASYPALLDNLGGRRECHYSARNRSGTTDPDAAAWTQTANRVLVAGLKIDRIDDGAGAGGSSGVIGGPNMRGGMAA